MYLKEKKKNVSTRINSVKTKSNLKCNVRPFHKTDKNPKRTAKNACTLCKLVPIPVLKFYSGTGYNARHTRWMIFENHRWRRSNGQYCHFRSVFFNFRGFLIFLITHCRPFKCPVTSPTHRHLPSLLSGAQKHFRRLVLSKVYEKSFSTFVCFFFYTYN